MPVPAIPMPAPTPAPASFVASIARLDVGVAAPELTISMASKTWLYNLQHRKRNAAKASTLATFASHARRIVGATGNVSVATFGNKQMKQFVADLAADSLSPKSIQEISGALKQIIASVVDADTGDRCYPRSWNHQFLDLPQVRNQSQPTITSTQLEAILADGIEPLDRCLWILLAVTGLRIGEARSLRIGYSANHSCWIPEDSVLHVRSAMWRAVEQSPKTQAAIRSVEICKQLNDVLLGFARGRKGSFLFGGDRAVPESTLRLHFDSHFENLGFHSLRRFRATYLAECGVPSAIDHYWIGHATQGVHDKYNKLAKNISLRREWAEKIGLGFTI